ncbi:unnamed protein product [Trichobilharzia szidati]|nr:unnamed protein product [Trichobilharzia szidati]
MRDKRMLSMNVSSLFTNVPLMEIVEITERQLDLEIPLCSLKELLLKCTMNVHFVFSNSYYRQVDGIGMGGSALGPILADFFLAKLENGKFKDIIREFDMYYRYVADTFILADGNVNIDELLLKFNNVHPSLTFTCEKVRNINCIFWMS